MPDANFPYTEAELDETRALQRLAFDSVVEIGSRLEPGVTEREACARIDAYLRERGIAQYLHEPFAWFGTRTPFARDMPAAAFLPSDAKLEEGMAFILDVGPARSGMVADIGYASCHGENAAVDRMLDDLEPYRRLILDGVRAEQTFAQIYRDVDRLILDQGYENCHQYFPIPTLAHRIPRLGPDPQPGHGLGFGPAAMAWIAEQMQARAADPSRVQRLFWAGGDGCDERLGPGLWAVEPQIGRGGIGVKWEELLIVTESDARWLDEDSPHVRRWKSRRLAA